MRQICSSSNKILSQWKEKMDPEKKELETEAQQEYVTPKLTRHGDVETLTSGSITRTTQTDLASQSPQ